MAILPSIAHILKAEYKTKERKNLKAKQLHDDDTRRKDKKRHLEANFASFCISWPRSPCSQCEDQMSRGASVSTFPRIIQRGKNIPPEY